MKTTKKAIDKTIEIISDFAEEGIYLWDSKTLLDNGCAYATAIKSSLKELGYLSPIDNKLLKPIVDPELVFYEVLAYAKKKAKAQKQKRYQDYSEKSKTVCQPVQDVIEEFTLLNFSDHQLVNELRERGYTVKCERVIEL